MSLLKPHILSLISASILLIIFLTGSGLYQENKSKGYKEVTAYNSEFIAVGSGGRIDQISISGKIIKSEAFPDENFNSVICDNKLIIVGGDQGMLRISTDGESFRKMESGSDRNINSLTIFNRIIIAGADNGVIIWGDPRGSFSEIQLSLKGNIVSLSSGMTDCYGVTDEGEIIHSTDGIHWEIIDFNQVYSGFYKHCFFTKVLVTENRIAIAGLNSDRLPVLMLSTHGGVWTERTLDYIDDQGARVLLEESPNDIAYDEKSDSFLLLCNKGRLMKLPSCSHCNEVKLIASEDLEGISLTANTMMIVGGNFLIRSLNRWL